MNKCPKILLSSALILTTVPAIADSPSWNYVRANVAIETVEIDGVNDDLEGNTFSFGGSFSPVDHFAVTAGYATGSADVSSNGNTVDMDLDGYTVGALFYTPINSDTDVFAGLNYSDLSVDLELNNSSYSSEDVDGYGLFVGVRGMVTPKLELSGVIERTKLDDDTNTDVSFEAGYYVLPDLSLNVGYGFSSDSKALGLGIVKYL